MNTQQLKQKILSLAIQGKLVSQDPADEPASVLLDRIQAEKARLVVEKKIKKEKPLPPVSEEERPFELPLGWTWTRLEQVSSNIQYGLSNSAEETGNHRLLRITDIQNNNVYWETVPFTTISKAQAEEFKLSNGDIVLARTGATVGKSFLVKDLSVESVFASYLIRVKLLHLSNEYIKFFFDTALYWSQITDQSVGVGQPNVNGTKLKGLFFPLPPLAEQHRIVTAIEAAFELIDTIDQNKASLLANVTLAKQKILSLAIQGKLVSQDPTDEPASVLLERIQTEKARLVAEKKIKKEKPLPLVAEEEWPFELPEGWIWARLGDLAHYKKGPFGSSITKSMFVPESDDAIKVYEQKNAIRKNKDLGEYFISKDKFLELQGFEVHPGDIIVSCAGTIGETYVLPDKIRKGVINQALMKITLHEQRLLDFYLVYFDFVLKDSANLEAKGTAMKNIPKFDVLKNYPVPLPPLAEQNRIARAIEVASAQLDEIASNLN